VKWRPIGREEYDRDVAAVEKGTFDLRIRPVRFSLKRFLVNPSAYNRGLEEVLHAR
jgi:hypothetical protein